MIDEKLDGAGGWTNGWQACGEQQQCCVSFTSGSVAADGDGDGDADADNGDGNVGADDSRDDSCGCGCDCCSWGDNTEDDDADADADSFDARSGDGAGDGIGVVLGELAIVGGVASPDKEAAPATVTVDEGLDVAAAATAAAANTDGTESDATVFAGDSGIVA